MNGRKPGENSGSVLSFTYLDVLVCTMGSLLLMLVMFGEQAKKAAIADAAKKQAKAAEAAAPPDGAAPTPPTEDPQALSKLLVDVQAHQAELDRMREEARQRLHDEQQRASHVEEHQRRLEHDLAKLHLTLRDLQQTEEKQSVDQEQAERDLARLTSLLADTETRVAAMRKESGGKRSYAIVPYKGPNGTSRRPIYIECTKDAIIIQPEGVKLTEEDFQSPIGAGNPLAAAVRAAHEELNARAAAAGQTELADPYPLFIVRPDGVNAYEVALAATKTWDSDYGYEFVDADWKLEYSEPDARLAQITEHAIEQARERQQLLAMAAPSRYLGRSSGGGGAGGGGVGAKGRAGNRTGYGQSAAASGTSASNSVQLAAGSNTGGGTFAQQATGPGPNYDNRYGERNGPSGTGSDPSSQGGPGDASGLSAAQQSSDQPGGQYAQSDATTGGAGSSAAGGGPNGQSGAPAGAAASGATASYATNGNSAQGSQSPSAEAFDPHAAPGSADRPPANGANVGTSSVALKDESVESAAKTRGENWANAAASRRSSAITRPIQVVVRPDQLAVLDPNDPSALAAGNGSVVSFHQPSERVLDQLAQAIQRQIKDWGIAGKGMYWRPELVFVVAPGAEPHAARLAALLDDSGVDVRLPQVAVRPQEGARATR